MVLAIAALKSPHTVPKTAPSPSNYFDSGLNYLGQWWANSALIKLITADFREQVCGVGGFQHGNQEAEA